MDTTGDFSTEKMSDILQSHKDNVCTQFLLIVTHSYYWLAYEYCSSTVTGCSRS